MSNDRTYLYNWSDLTDDIRERVERAEDGLRLFDQAVALLTGSNVYYCHEAQEALRNARSAAQAISDRQAAIALQSLRVSIPKDEP